MIDAGEKFFLGCYQIVPVEETFLRAGDVVIARDLLPEQTICDTFVELLRPTINQCFSLSTVRYTENWTVLQWAHHWTRF